MDLKPSQNFEAFIVFIPVIKFGQIYHCAKMSTTANKQNLDPVNLKWFYTNQQNILWIQIATLILNNMHILFDRGMLSIVIIHEKI